MCIVLSFVIKNRRPLPHHFSGQPFTIHVQVQGTNKLIAFGMVGELVDRGLITERLWYVSNCRSFLSQRIKL